MKSIVLERFGDAIRFHPRFLELAGHYHFAVKPCRPARGNEKGRVERLIRFFAARSFTTLEDFNRQALLWRDRIAHLRPWPGDDSRTIAQVFAEEKARLLPLPTHPFECDLVKTVRSDKTIYVNFDGNAYSIPHPFVRQPLTLVASPTTVRILDGQSEIARHRRSYDRIQQIEDPAQIAALVEQKRKAMGGNRCRAAQACRAGDRSLFGLRLEPGESIAHQTKRLLLLLDDYGAAELAQAINEALQQNTPRVNSVAFILTRRHRQPYPN